MLIFGVNSASKVFQQTVHKTFADIKGTANVSDDVLCFKKSKDHNSNIQAIFHCLTVKGLTLNAKKCEYKKISLEFPGHIFGKDGITPSAN